MHKIGVVGLNAGNGHPYSFSSVFNGFDPEALERYCDYPIIRKYLTAFHRNQKFIDNARIDCIYAPEAGGAERVAKVAKIPNIAGSLEELAERCDAILFTRDDVWNHWEMAGKLFETGKPTPGIENVGIVGLYPKKDIYPFEEAKLYGHNASHFLLGVLAARMGCKFMSDAVRFPEIVALTKRALLEECSPALCAKFKGVDPYFEQENYNKWAVELVRRMTSPLLSDSVDRVIRDIDRKLAWQDRIIGAMRLCLSQGVKPSVLAQGAALAARYQALDALQNVWPEGDERAAVTDLIRAAE